MTSNTTTRGLLLLLACACGAAVSNICYTQPLLEQIRLTFATNAAGAGMVTMLTQVGYTLGLLFLVPLGDVVRRRPLIVGLMFVEAVFLAASALSSSLWALQVASFGLGVASVSAQLIVPVVAQLSPPEKRGQNVGTVMSGLLMGILLGRVVAGGIGGVFGWRAMLGLAALLSVAMGVFVGRALPDLAPPADVRFRKLMGSMLSLFKEEPRLRESAFVGAFIFATFMAFWSTISFYLQAAPFHFSTQAVGLFSLVGVAGALVAPWAGQAADRRGARAVIGLSTLVVAASFGLFWLVGASLLGLALGVLVMDAGVQATHIANQTRYYALRPEARSRVNTVYMVIYFTGGSLGSLVGTLAWNAYGWSGVCATGFAFGLAGWVVHTVYGATESDRGPGRIP